MFNLRHALQKVTSQHRQFDCLIRFAHSPRLQAALQSELTILCVVPPQPRVVSLPQSVNKWKNISKAIVPQCDSVQGKWRMKEAESLNKAFSHKGTMEAPVHCECSLIAYWTEESRSAIMEKRNEQPQSHQPDLARTPHNNSGRLSKGKVEKSRYTATKKRQLSKAAMIAEKWRGVPCFSYIGVSKLSCNPCQIWIAGYNRQQGPEFYTRGTHGKWYWPWGISATDESVLGQYMVSEICAAYYEYCRSQHRLKRTSDGSNAATNGEPRPHDERDHQFISACMGPISV